MYRTLAAGLVFFEEHAIVTERQPVSRHPLIRRLSSLGRNASKFDVFGSKIHLKPLVNVVCSSAPTTRVHPQPPQIGLTRNAGSRHGGVWNLPILKSHRCHAFWDLWHLEALEKVDEVHDGISGKREIFGSR